MNQAVEELTGKTRQLAELEPDEPFDNKRREIVEDSDGSGGWSKLGEPVVDTRECVSCRGVGDHAVCGRLLPLDTNWIHVNCLLCVEGVSIDEFVVQDLQNLFAKQKTVTAFRQVFSPILFIFLFINDDQKIEKSE